MSSLSLGPHELAYVMTAEQPAVIFLHGIMGGKRNLQTFIKRFVEEFDEEAISFDLRNHAESSKHWSPFTVAAVASDIVQASNALMLSPQAIIGHSFGAKVALLAAAALESVQQVWLLDCPPGPLRENPSEKKAPNTNDITTILSELSWPMPTRRALVEALQAHGVDNAIALWMTTNLETRDDGLYLIFDPLEIKEMLLDFIHLDTWPVVEQLATRMEIHLVAAERGGRVTENDAKMLAKIAPRTGHFHQLKNAGHFVHTDNPAGLLELMKPYFTHR